MTDINKKIKENQEKHGEWYEGNYDSSYRLKTLKALDALDDPKKTKRQKQNAMKVLSLSREKLYDLERLQVANWLIYDVLKIGR